jgi:hypothetical protein
MVLKSEKFFILSSIVLTIDEPEEQNGPYLTLEMVIR